MRAVYVAVVRTCGRALDRVGVLGWLDRASSRSRWALWARSLFSIYDSDVLVKLGVPWWTFKAADAVDTILRERPGAIAFEWGSGASTHWLAARCARVTAVEHDPQWYQLVTGGLQANATVWLVEAVPLATLADRPAPVLSAKRGFGGHDFANYVGAIADANGPFDLIVIDGRARAECLRAAQAHLKPNGVIVFDNTERRRYRRAIAELATFRVRWTVGLTPSLPYPTSTALLTPTAN